jgi:tripartite-type tricarboxylate transporter receptor subunit TctC
MRRLCLTLALAAVALHAAGAVAQNYPGKPIRIVVPFVAGGAVDALARMIGVKLSESLGQPVIVENRPGAGGNIAADAVAKSPPDGYTILQNTNGQAISPAIYRALPFDVVRDFRERLSNIGWYGPNLDPKGALAGTNNSLTTMPMPHQCGPER